jgi:hypothetical protein
MKLKILVANLTIKHDWSPFGELCITNIKKNR